MPLLDKLHKHEHCVSDMLSSKVHTKYYLYFLKIDWVGSEFYEWAALFVYYNISVLYVLTLIRFLFILSMSFVLRIM